MRELGSVAAHLLLKMGAQALIIAANFVSVSSLCMALNQLIDFESEIFNKGAACTFRRRSLLGFRI
jgi:hypothetical protein